MRISTLLFTVICGAVLTIAADSKSYCGDPCDASVPPPSNCPENVIDRLGCLCKDTTYNANFQQCLAKHCTKEEYNKHMKDHEETYNKKEDYPGQNCVNQCKRDWLADLHCKAIDDWNCLCAAEDFAKHIDHCTKIRNCPADGIKAEQAVRKQQCGQSNNNGGGKKGSKHGKKGGKDGEEAVPRSLQKERRSVYHV
uniref:CFEM domain-containing protein n=1 Tax=Moniliophthora roreri TaxID=221103 RepID=A0A0W0FPX5_MONRR